MAPRPDLPPFPSVGGTYGLNKKGDGWALLIPTTGASCEADLQAAEPAALPEQTQPEPPQD